MANINLVAAAAFEDVYKASIAQLKLAPGVRPRPRKEVSELLFNAGLIPSNADHLSVDSAWLAGDDVDPATVVADLHT